MKEFAPDTYLHIFQGNKRLDAESFVELAKSFGCLLSVRGGSIQDVWVVETLRFYGSRHLESGELFQSIYPEGQ